MSANLKRGLRAIVLIWLLSLNLVQGVPSADQLGSILGYPSSELIVEDVTDKERDLWATPSGTERRSGVMTSPTPSSLIAAYQITGKNPQTFHPTRIWVARKGTFLTDEVKKLLAAIGAQPPKLVSEGGRGPLGPIEFEGAESAGLYLGDVKTPRRTGPIREPHDRVAIIMVAQLAEPTIDIRIAMMAALEEGAQLQALPGGDAYYQAMTPPEGSEPPRYDVAKMFKEVAREALAAAPIASIEKKDASTETAKTGSMSDESSDIPHASRQTTEGTSYRWIWILVSLVVISGVAVFLKRRS